MLCNTVFHWIRILETSRLRASGATDCDPVQCQNVAWTSIPDKNLDKVIDEKVPVEERIVKGHVWVIGGVKQQC